VKLVFIRVLRWQVLEAFVMILLFMCIFSVSSSYLPRISLVFLCLMLLMRSSPSMALPAFTNALTRASQTMAVHLFSEQDPKNFKTFSKAMLSLFQVPRVPSASLIHIKTKTRCYCFITTKQHPFRGARVTCFCMAAHPVWVCVSRVVSLSLVVSRYRGMSPCVYPLRCGF
jgi:hypothetical protein